MMAETTAETAVATAVPKLTIRVRDLVLDYEVFEDRRAALRQRLVTKQGTGRSLVHALKGVSFDAAEGDAIGVVGPNGSGKSTLLAALAGLLAPTSGEVLVAEEPKLLGVGATLIAAATGYRNIRLGCLALGMSNSEVNEQDRRDRRVHRHRRGDQPAAADVLVRDAGPPALRHRHVRQAADPAHRRGAVGRRQGLPGEVDGTHRGDRRPRRNADARQPLDGRDRPTVHPGAVDRGLASSSPTARSTTSSRPTASPELPP